MSNSNNTSPSNSDFEYVPILEGSIDSTQIKTNVNTKSRNNKGWCCCSFITIIGICLFLLIPRTSHFAMYNISYNITGKIVGRFKAKNNNYYTQVWKKTDVKLFWIPYNGQTVGPLCYSSTCDSNYYVDGMCAIRLGDFKSNDEFSTKPKSGKKIDIKLTNATIEESACALWMLLNPYNNLPQRLITYGEVQIKNTFTSYYNYKIPTEYYYLN